MKRIARRRRSADSCAGKRPATLMVRVNLNTHQATKARSVLSQYGLTLLEPARLPHRSGQGGSTLAEPEAIQALRAAEHGERLIAVRGVDELLAELRRTETREFR